MVELINRAGFEKQTAHGAVIVDFGANWCPDCRKIEPILEALSKDYEGKVKIYKINIDAEEELKDELGVKRIPTLMFFKDGKEITERLVEPDNKLPIETALKKLL
ncbi:thioredoxin family protein [Helicobacter cappadocius]|uniref:Thioredoxin family protein n=1 Tax=Helicobacter cappadocius TaxID=3063998 RepID=A0AA90PJA7_9HELI|nr:MULTISPECIES: thioredoxin family protein [unclassified Helicobacter]MDO7252833.1 thioredoxin family protein [Helicobacter sp. faydin-H75]MDP2538876.1 thioredoxin family protein [Helicobacter sp. faydin-H76]